AAEVARGRLDGLAAESQDPYPAGFVIETNLLFATLAGDFAWVARERAELWRLGGDTGSMTSAAVAIARSCGPAWYYLGHPAEAAEAHDHLVERSGVQRIPLRIRRAMYVSVAQPTAANLAELRALIDEHLPQAAEADASYHLLSNLLQAAVVARHRRACATLLPLLSSLGTLAIWHGFDCTTPGRFLGDAARLLGDRAAARAYYLAAIAAADGIDHRPERAVSRLCLAELL